MPTVIRLDTKALQWFIAHMGEEFKVEFSRAVISEAARTLVRNLFAKEAEAMMETYVRQEIADKIGEYKGYPRKAVLKPHFQAEINAKVSELARQSISKAYDKFLEVLKEKEASWADLVADKVEQRFNQVTWAEIEKHIKQLVHEQIDAMTTLE